MDNKTKATIGTILDILLALPMVVNIFEALGNALARDKRIPQKRWDQLKTERQDAVLRAMEVE